MFLYRFRRHLRIVPIVLVVVFSVASIAITLFTRGRMLMQEQIDLRLISTASVAAQHFDASDLDTIRGNEYIHTDTLLAVSRKLDQIRLSIPNINSASILRPTVIPGVLEYVADARLVWPLTDIDKNQDGIIDSAEEQIFPGDRVQVFGLDAFQDGVFQRPTISRPLNYFGNDVPVIAYAPIKRANNELAAILAISMDSTEYSVLANNTVTPIILTLLILFALLIGGYTGLFFFKRRAEIIERIEREQLAKQELSAHQLGGAYSIVRKLQQMGCIQSTCADINAEKVDESIDRIGMIVDDLGGSHDFAFSKISKGSPKPISIVHIVKKVTQQMTDRFHRHGLVVTTNIADDILVHSDVQLLHGMIREILDNSVYYSAHGSEITISARKKRSYIEVTISDTGYGISDDDMERIFEKFIRGKDAQKYHPTGLGLGLHICRQLAMLMGGMLIVESEQFKGTTVIIRLPIEK